MLTSKQGLHLSKVHSEMKTFMKQSKETAPNWSFILMLLMTIHKVFESGWICVDQRLNLVFESRVILHGMPPNSSIVFTFGIDIVPFWIWRSSRPCGNDRNPIVLDQYGEQLSIGHWKWMVHLGPFPFVVLGTTWIRLLIIFLCKPLGRMKTEQGDLGIPWWTRMILDKLFPCRMWSFFAPSFLKHCLNTSIETNLFFFHRACPVSVIFPLLIPSSILPTEYIKSPNSTKALTTNMP